MFHKSIQICNTMPPFLSSPNLNQLLSLEWERKVYFSWSTKIFWNPRPLPQENEQTPSVTLHNASTILSLSLNDIYIHTCIWCTFKPERFFVQAHILTQVTHKLGRSSTQPCYILTHASCWGQPLQLWSQITPQLPHLLNNNNKKKSSNYSAPFKTNWVKEKKKKK